MLNEEEGMQDVGEIVDYQMGFGHDVVMVEKADSRILDVQQDEEKLENQQSLTKA